MKVWTTPEGYEAIAETKDEAARKIAKLLDKAGGVLSPGEVIIRDKLTEKPVKA